MHTVVTPVTGDNGLTAIGATTRQPVPNVYVIIAVPEATPVAVPELPSIVATLVLPDVQAPPEVKSLNVVVCPAHTYGLPDIADGIAITVTVCVVIQPVSNV
jgi:hypothetical protein